MNEIIERSLGFTDEMMADRCESLMRVISKTVSVKKGRGDDAYIDEIPKYKIEPEVMARVKKSIEHYKSADFKFRDYQVQIIDKSLEILKTSRFVYLAMEVRTGKTLTSLGIADKLGVKNVLFVTKKKAISSIEVDYNTLKPSYEITIINYESLHTVMNDKKWDLIVCDESHSCFLGSTLVDDKRIKDINIGDYLKSFNFEKGFYEKKKVTNLYKNKLNENLIKIKCNGKEIICTESHKIFTKRGWVKAGELLPNDSLQVL